MYELLNYMEIDLDDYEKEMLSDKEKRSLKGLFKKKEGKGF